MKKKLLILLTIPFLLDCGKAEEKPSSEEEKQEEQEPDPESTPEPEPEPEPDPEPTVKTETATIVFENHFQTYTLDDKKYDVFVEEFNADAGVDLLASVETDGYVQINDFGTKQEKHTTLCFGSKNYEGSMSLTFAYEIQEIEFTAQAYYKVNGSYDDGVTFVVEGDKHSLPKGDSTHLPEEQVIKYEPKGKTVTMKNEGLQKRVFLNQMKVTYVVEAASE